MKRGRQESNLRRPAFQAGALPAELRPHAGDPKHPLLTVSWRVAERPYASGTVLGHTARSQEGGQRHEAGGPAAAGQGSVSRRGWPRTSDLLFVRQALVPTELLALGGPEGSRTLEPPLFCRSYHYGAAALPNSQLSGPRIRDKESNLDLQGQGLASCRLDDPGILRAGTPAPKRPPASRETPRAASHARAARCS